MKRKFLEEMGLSKEQVDAILDENSQDIGKAKAEVTTIQTELQNAKTEIEGLNNQLSERNKQLSELKNSTGDVEALKNQISELQTANKTKEDEHKAEMQQLKIDMAVETALVGAKAKNIKAVKALLNLDGAELAEDGTIKGLAEQILKLSKADDSKFLFDSAKTIVKGAKIGEGSDDIIEGGDTSKMSYSELCAYLAENPNANLS